MNDQSANQYSVTPGFVGLLACVLLILSRYFSNVAGAGMESLSTVLVIVALCVCVHLVRRTSALYQPHVWNAWQTVGLAALPITMFLLVIAQIILFRTPAFFETRTFSAVFTLVSLPVFFCLYFLYVGGKKRGGKKLRVFSRVLLAAGIAYTVLRLLDKVLFPLISQWAGKAINPTVLRAAGWNTHLSFIVYLICVCGFFIMMRSETRAAVPEETAPAPEKTLPDADGREEE